MLKILCNCFYRKITNKDERRPCPAPALQYLDIKSESSSDSGATILPFDFIPGNESDHHRISNT